MDRKLINYLPPVLREVLDFQEINKACEPEISIAWDALALVMANQFLDSATEDGVQAWERELQIYPKATDTLEMRKARIKLRWNMNAPITVPWLRQWLAGICGDTGYAVEITDYTLRIEYIDFDGDTAEIQEQLREYIPANMQLGQTITSTLAATIYAAGDFSSYAITRLPWDETTDDDTGDDTDETPAGAMVDETGAVLVDEFGFALIE